jgi:hypothetical protein
MWTQRGIPADAILTGERPTRETAVCPRRLRKAARLFADKMGPGQYAIRGDSGTVYHVDLSQDIPCFCKDSEFSAGIICKHRLRAMMGEGDERILYALGVMLQRDAEIAAEYHRTLRRAHRQTQARTE